jgi:hypothetical protein
MQGWKFMPGGNGILRYRQIGKLANKGCYGRQPDILVEYKEMKLPSTLYLIAT